MSIFGLIRKESEVSNNIRKYERMRIANNWCPGSDIDWKLDGDFSDEIRKLSISLAIQGTYTEEVGMLVSAKLIGMIDDLPTRYCLAVQTADEARHSEVFGRYTDEWENRFSPETNSPEKPTKLLNNLLETSDEIELFALHTMLEGLAMDQFGLLANAFEGDKLGQIYRRVRMDESRHVAMGMEFLKSALCQLEPEEALSKLSKCKAELFAVANMDESLFVTMAKLTDNTSSELNRRFTERVNARFEFLQSQVKEKYYENA